MADKRENSDNLFGRSDLLALAVELELVGRTQSTFMIGGTRAKNAGSAIRELLQTLEGYEDKRPSYVSSSSELNVQLKRIEHLLLHQEQRLLKIETHLVDHGLTLAATERP